MFDKVLAKMHQSVRINRLIVQGHAYDEVIDDDLLKADLENCVLSGWIAERQWDEDFKEWKYLVEGKTLDYDNMCVVARLGYNEATVVITAFRLL